MPPDDPVANLVTAIVFALFASLVFFMIAGSNTPGFNEMCAEGAPKVFGRLEKVESYVVESPAGCVSFCTQELLRGDVAFLEYEATDASPRWLKGSAGKEPWPWLPDKPGKYAFRIRNDVAACAELLRDPEASASTARINACMVVEPRDAFESRVEYRMTQGRKAHVRGFLTTRLSELVDRTTSKTLARHVSYYYDGRYPLLPLPLYKRCPNERFLNISDIKK